MPIHDNEKSLRKFNLKLVKQNDITTTVYRRMQFVKKDKKVASTSEVNAQPFPSENSLQFFVRTNCALTSHDVDFVFVERFKKQVRLSFNRGLPTFSSAVLLAFARCQTHDCSSQYHETCKKFGMQPIPLSTDSMSKQFGVTEDRVNVHYVSRIQHEDCAFLVSAPCVFS